MSPRARAYNELVDVLLSDEDRVKFEWAIGSMLDRGRRNVVIICGPPASGKSTLLNIVKKVLFAVPTSEIDYRVAIQHDGYKEVDHDTSVFAASLVFEDVENSITICTTGNRVPVNKHYVLMREINSELMVIANDCVYQYRSLGDDYFGEIRESNR
jgi:predicted ATPase